MVHWRVVMHEWGIDGEVGGVHYYANYPFCLLQLTTTQNIVWLVKWKSIPTELHSCLGNLTTFGHMFFHPCASSRGGSQWVAPACCQLTLFVEFDWKMSWSRTSWTSFRPPIEIAYKLHRYKAMTSILGTHIT